MFKNKISVIDNSILQFGNSIKNAHFWQWNYFICDVLILPTFLVGIYMAHLYNLIQILSTHILA